MNLALPAAVILLLALPGFLARRGYLSGVFTKRHLRTNLGDELVLGLVLSVPLQFLGGWLYTGLAGWMEWPIPSWALLLRLLTNEYGDSDAQFVWIAERSGLTTLAAQQSSLWGVAYGLGHLTRCVVRLLKLDRRWQFFRSGNDWYYLLRGEVVEMPDLSVPPPDTDDFLTWVDVLTRCGTCQVIYSGVLDEFFLNERGELARLYILEPVVRQADNLGEELPKGRPVRPNSVFVIHGQDVVNINVVYQGIPSSSEPGRLISDFGAVGSAPAPPPSPPPADTVSGGATPPRPPPAPHV